MTPEVRGWQPSFMNLQEFRESLLRDEPPAGLSDALAGLWWDAKGNWTRAHESAQQDKNQPGAWVHAYPHGKEGDLGNAAYWYRRAGQPVASDSLAVEWERITVLLLAKG